MDTEVIKVLLIEDNPGDARLIQEMLLEQGSTPFELEWLDSLAEGMQRLADGETGLVLLDLGLPDSQGLETLNEIQTQAPHLPVLVMTGLADEAVGIEAIAGGAQDYLIKGQVDGKLLIRAMRYAVERKRMQEELSRHRDLLEEMVRERTAELEKVNQQLRKEIGEHKTTEERLRISEERYRALLDVAGKAGEAIVFAQDIEGREAAMPFVNEPWLQVVGYTRVELDRMSFFDLVHPDNIQDVRNRYGKRIRGEAVTGTVEFSVLRKDGVIVPLAAKIGTTLYRGRPAVVAYLRDITERRNAEKALRKSETSLAEAQRMSHIGNWELDIVSNTLSWSDEIYRIFGLEPQQFRATYEAFLDNIHPDDREIVDRAYTESVKTKTPYSIVHRLLLKDGSVKYVNERCLTLYDNQGKPIRSLGTVQDITERILAEEQIRKAAEEWLTTFDSITDLVSIHDKDFRFVRVNRAFAEAFKLEPEEFIGKTCYEIVHATDEPLPDCPHRQTLKDGRPHRIESFEPHLGIHLEISTSPIFNEQREVVGTVHITKDVTERKKMEEQLVITDRLASIGELASGIAHELNNPLTGVIGYSDLLLEREFPDDVRDDLKVINEEAKRTSRVVRNLLTFARKHPEEKQSTDINSIIEKVLQLRAYEQRVNNITIVKQMAADLPEVIANSFELQQVFINIIINAEHFMSEAHSRGTLTITTEQAGDFIRASFADDGPGITPENLGHLFDPFFTTKEVGSGTGLGLSISYGIITAHGGRIYAESEMGKGATFIVELPVTDEQ
jgi:PAS domain S-box-containing protein